MVIYSAIKETFDDEKLDNIINNMEKRQTPRYIIMNDKTLEVMINNLFPQQIEYKNNGSYPEYRGIPIATCNNLGNGVVEVL